MFKHGAQSLMWEIQQQNEALSAKMMLEILSEVEDDWIKAPNPWLKCKLEEFACVLLILFGATLQGKEIYLVSLKGMLSTWLEYTTSSPHPHIMTLHGRFKGETGLRWHCLSISIHNTCSLPYKIWIAQLLWQWLLEEGHQWGWLFARPDGTLQTFSEMDPFLLDYLGHVHSADPSIKSSLADLQDFCLWHFPRSGATTQAANKGVQGTTILPRHRALFVYRKKYTLKVSKGA
jgi:hypothetical protein